MKTHAGKHGDPRFHVDDIAALKARVAELEAAAEIVERTMTQHCDMAACRCLVCSDGRRAGLRPREKYLYAYGAKVRVDP